MSKRATVTAVVNQKGGTGKTTTCENLGIGLANEMQSEGVEVATQVADTADQTSLATAMQQAVQTYGVPDVLFYNVGITAADADVSGGIN
ncbi:MAG: ParA family protein, partial [Clostridiales bacterium]|nr:ParA family protein [Clostridiales bacterium]